MNDQQLKDMHEKILNKQTIDVDEQRWLWNSTFWLIEHNDRTGDNAKIIRKLGPVPDIQDEFDYVEKYGKESEDES